MSTTTIEPEPFITTKIKGNKDFQNHLGSLARSDAHHDLGTEFKTGDYNKNQTLKTVFNSGLPSIQNQTPNFQDYHETGSLISVMLKIGDNTINNESGDKDNLFKSILKSIVEVNPAKNATKSAPTICQIGYRNPDGNGQPLFNYNAVKFSNDGKKFNSKTFANDFFVNTNLGGANGKEAAVIVDFAQCQFFELLAGGGRATDFSVHYLMTSEMVNDPAGKPNISNKSLFGTDTGVNVNSYIQTDAEPISYSSYDINNPNTTNNFFSKYDFKLSPIQQIFTKGSKSEKLISTLNISLEDGKNKPLVDTIEDSKSENSITTVLGYLRKIIQNLIKLTTPESNRVTTFNFNSKCQQKRSGDWFQALCCLDVRNRNYTQILPDVGRKPFKLNANCPVYFVTHDQIAVAYALLNGVNVIYFSHGKAIFVFKNSADLTVKGSGMSVEKIYFDGMKTTYVDNRTPDINTLLGYATKYEDARQLILDDESSKFNKEINTAVSNSSDKEFMKSVDKLFKGMFAQAVRLMFVNINLTDITNAIANINANKYILDGGYDSKNDAKIITLNKSFDLINCVLDRFGKETVRGSYLQVAIAKWIDSNVKKLDVYNAATKIDLYDKIDEATFDINRITEFDINTANKRATDKYIFLPFIKTLNYTQKNQIVSVLKGLVGKLKQFLQNQSGSPASTGLTQLVQSFIGKRVTGELKLYNNAANLIFESLILLDTTNEQPPINETPAPDPITKEDILVLFSTDDIIINEDLTEILALLNGKNSNTPDEDPPNEESVVAKVQSKVGQSGGDILNYYHDRPNVRGNTICDVSVRQMTYPLLSNELITTLIKFSNDNYDDTTEQPVEEPVEEPADKSVTPKRPPVIPENISAEALREMFNKYRQTDGGSMAGGGPNEYLLENYNLGYHPLLPIYMLLSPFYYSLGPKYDSYPYFDTYFTYFNILNKMVTVLQTNYLNNPTEKDQITDGYLIGFGLGHMLFTSNTSLVLTNAILASIEMEQSEYYNFSLKNDCLSSLITGSIHLNAREERSGVDLLTNSIFKQFINEEVNIKQMLGEEIPSEGLTYVTIQQNVLTLLKTIAAKIKNDRNPNSWEKAKLRQPTQVQGITPSQLSSVSMKTGTTSTPDTWSSLTSSLTSPIGVGTGGFLKTKKQKRKNKKNLKTKRQKNKRSNKKSTKKQRRRKQSKKTRKH
jgi:hypothetical protein